jgi:hypothetical protein
MKTNSNNPMVPSIKGLKKKLSCYLTLSLSLLIFLNSISLVGGLICDCSIVSTAILV